MRTRAAPPSARCAWRVVRAAQTGAVEEVRLAQTAGPADGQAGDLQATAGRRRPARVWPDLPQKPMPVSKAKSSPTMLDPGQRRGAVADQGRALHRRGDLAVLDQIGLGALEDELAVGDVHLAAADSWRSRGRA